MKLLRTIPLLIAVASSVSASSRIGGMSLRAACGSSEVVKTATIPYGNKTLTMTETLCPGFAAIRNATTPRRGLVERQALPASCSDGDCTVDCTATGGGQPLLTDCIELGLALGDLNPQTFQVAAGAFQGWTLGGTCAFGFGNLDTFPYNVCYLGFAYNGGLTADSCLTSSPTGGFCLAPASELWGIEVYFP